MNNKKKAIIVNCIGFLLTALLITPIFAFYDNSKGKSMYVMGGGYDIEGNLNGWAKGYQFIETVDFDLKSGDETTIYSGINKFKGIAFSVVSTDNPISYVFYLTDEDGGVETSEGMLHEENASYYEMRKGVSFKLVCSADDKYSDKEGDTSDIVQSAKCQIICVNASQKKE